jgi:hypothetical protein
MDIIIGQLAARYPPYRRVLTEKLIDNPRILELPTGTRFKKLIHEPWKALQESHRQYIAAPPVIVLGWDSDYGDELLYSICEFGSWQCSPSLLWIISFDGNMKLPIPGLLHPLVPFGYTTVPVCYDDGPSDAALILHHQFSSIRKNYEEMLDRDEKWPSDEQMSHLIRIVSGVIKSIDAITEFVNLEDGGGPEAHLDTFLSYMVDSPSPSDERPYCAIDHFYNHASSNIPPHLLSVANQVLGIIYYTEYNMEVTPLQIACLLSVETDTVLSIYPYLSGWASTRVRSSFLPTTVFRSFLKDPKRSGQAPWYNPKSGPVVFEAFLRFLSYSSNLLEFLKSRVQMTPVTPNTYIELEDLRRTVSIMLCIPDMASRRACLERMLILRFDFRCLAYTSDVIYASTLRSFLCSLYDVSALFESMMRRIKRLFKLDKCNSPNIVRVEPAGPLDKQFIDKCEGLAEPWV